jgi:hypothetical protein
MAVALGQMDTVLNLAVGVVAQVEMLAQVVLVVAPYLVLAQVEEVDPTLALTEGMVDNGVIMEQGVEVLEAMVQQLHQMRQREMIEDLVVETVAGVEVQPLTIIHLMVEQEEMGELQAVVEQEVESLVLLLVERVVQGAVEK